MASHNAQTIEISSFKTRAGQSWKLSWPHERVFSAQKVCIFSCRYISCGYSVLPPRQMACHFSFFLRHRVVVFAILKNCCLPNSVKNSLLVENRKICCFLGWRQLGRPEQYGWHFSGNPGWRNDHGLASKLLQWQHSLNLETLIREMILD